MSTRCHVATREEELSRRALIFCSHKSEDGGVCAACGRSRELEWIIRFCSMMCAIFVVFPGFMLKHHHVLMFFRCDKHQQSKVQPTFFRLAHQFQELQVSIVGK